MLNDSAQILIILLSATLILFLVMASVLLYKAMQVVATVRRISERAEHMAQNVEDTAAFFRRTAGQLSMFRIIANIVEGVHKKSKTQKGKK